MPLHTKMIVRSGQVVTGGGYLKAAGFRGDDWSRSGNTLTNVYNLSINVSESIPSRDDYRYVGFSLRCLQE